MFYKNLKTRIAPALCVLLLVLGITSATSAKPVLSPEDAAAQFYKWYINALNQDKFPRSQQKQRLLTYLSKRFGKWVYSIPDDEYDADVFINAQDWDKDWEQAISTSKAVVKGNAATLNVTLGVSPNGKVIKSKWKHRLRLKMVMEGGLWKIDRIDSVNS